MTKNERIKNMKVKQEQNISLPGWTIIDKFVEVAAKNTDKNAIITFASMDEFNLCENIKNKILYYCLVWNKYLVIRKIQNNLWFIKSTENYNLVCNDAAYCLLQNFNGSKTVWDTYNESDKKNKELVFYFIEPEVAYSSENIINSKFSFELDSLEKIIFISDLLIQRGFLIIDSIQYMMLPTINNIKPFIPSCEPVYNPVLHTQSLSNTDVLIIGDKPGIASVGILYLASYLKENGINAKTILIDGFYTALEYKTRLINYFKKTKPRCIGISMKWFPHIRKVYETAAIIKEYDPSIKVVVGGDTASYYSINVISHPCIDYLVYGDGEEAFLKICIGDNLIPNTYSKQGDKIIQHSNTTITSVDSYLTDLDEIVIDSSGVLYTTIYLPLSRGCHYNCVQCGGSKAVQQLSFKNNCNTHTRSSDLVRKDIIATQKYTASYMFSISNPQIENYNFFYDIYNGLNLSNHFCALFCTGIIDYDVVKYVVNVFKFVRFGIDICSLSEKHRKKINDMTDGKPQISDNELFEFMRLCEQFENCEVDIYSIAGMPYYSDSDIDEENRVLDKLKRFRCFHSLEWGRLHAQPGALLAEHAEKFEMSSSANCYENYLDYSNKNYYSDNGYPEMSSYNYPYIDYKQKGKTDRILMHYMEMSYSIKKHRREQLYEKLIPNTISYRYLNMMSNHIAYYLLSEGLQKEDRVILYTKNRIMLAIAIMGVIKAGGCYIPLDIQLHKKSIDNIVEQIHPLIVLTDTEYVNENSRCMISLLRQETEKRDLCKLTKENVLYHIYSSGTTDKPKCISIKQAGVVNYTNWRIHVYDIQKEDVILQILSEAFDGFYSNFFTSLLAGSCLIMPTSMQNRDIPFLIKIILYYKATHASMLPFYLKLLEQANKNNLHTFKSVVLAGDMSDEKFIKMINEKYTNLILINEYGPTENSIATTAFIGMDGQDSRMIGVPISNVHVYIINDKGNIVDVGHEGEISISGVGLYSGYYPNDPKLFLTPFNEWVYRSGDLGIKNKEGDIILMGRIDRQVKISGIAVNLDALENLLKKIEYISDIAVTYNNGKLVANIVLDDNNKPDNYLQEIRSKLPFYAESITFSFCSSLPRMSRGKIDYRMLAISDEKSDNVQKINPYIKVIKDLWKEELGDKKFSNNDNFFDIGGNSLIIMKIYEKLDSLYPDKITITNMFQYYTVNMLADYLLEQIS